MSGAVTFNGRTALDEQSSENDYFPMYFRTPAMAHAPTASNARLEPASGTLVIPPGFATAAFVMHRNPAAANRRVSVFLLIVFCLVRSDKNPKRPTQLGRRGH